MKSLLLGLLVVGLSFNLSAVSGAFPEQKGVTTETLDLGNRYIVFSKLLGGERQILVRLPDSYQSGAKAYPVVYLLDGDSHFGHGSLGARLLEENERMAEAIIVALPNNSGTRGRDLARAQDNFRRFIGEEVFAFVKENFRVTDQRTLFGHSLAGYFTLTLLADHPEMFDNYIAASPVVQVRGSELYGKFDKLFEASSSLGKSLYFTITNRVNEVAGANEALDKMIALFKEKAPADLHWRYDFIDAQVHMTTPFLTLYNGLGYVFQEFQAPSFESTEAYEAFGGLSALQAHFSARAEKYGTEPAIPETTFSQLGYLFQGEGQHERAIRIFEENAALYDTVPIAFNALGDGHNTAGRFQEARDAYQKAAELAEEQGSPNAAFFQRRAQAMEAKLNE